MTRSSGGISSLILVTITFHELPRGEASARSRRERRPLTPRAMPSRTRCRISLDSHVPISLSSVEARRES